MGKQKTRRRKTSLPLTLKKRRGEKKSFYIQRWTEKQNAAGKGKKKATLGQNRGKKGWTT